jgi:peptidoglycan/xylan/chitin deacetylase (PgdA/CDA1 family)
MRRKNSRYPRTSYARGGQPSKPSPARSGLTRRALLGAAGVIGAGGLVEMLRGSPHRAAAVARDASHRVLRHPGATSNQGAVAPSTAHRAASAGRGAARGRSAGRGHDSAHHAHGHRHGHGHGHGDAPPHQHGHHGGHDAGHGAAARRERARARKAEQVKLPPPQVRVRKHPIYRVDEIDHHPPKKAIALTIDDGPDPDWTPKVLRLLDKYHMQASFCLVGVHADAYPKLVRDIHKAGHVIVNHSYTHIQPFASQTEQRIVTEITRTQRAIEKAAKVTPELFRSPGGDWSHFLFRAVAAYGLTPLDWDIDPIDWARPGTLKIEHAMLKGRPGDIVLCHDGGGNRSETVRALRKVLPTWKRRGYTTIPLIVPASAQRVDHTPPSAGASASPSANPSGSSAATTGP